jgi:hypothetical protein
MSALLAGLPYQVPATFHTTCNHQIRFTCFNGAGSNGNRIE